MENDLSEVKNLRYSREQYEKYEMNLANMLKISKCNNMKSKLMRFTSPVLNLKVIFDRLTKMYPGIFGFSLDLRGPDLHDRWSFRIISYHAL